MHKDNAAACRLHSALDSTPSEVGALCARCEDTVSIMYLEAASGLHFDNNTSNPEMYSNMYFFSNAKASSFKL